MVFEFLFSTSKTKASISHFIDFLEYHASKKNLKFAHRFDIFTNHNSYSFYLETQPQKALEFAEYIGARLPMSLYFNFVSLQTPQDISLKWQTNSEKIPSFPDAFEVGQMLNKDSESFCSLNGWVKNIEFMGENITETKSLIDIFTRLALCLKNGESLRIKTSRGTKQFSFVKKSQNIMFWDLSNILTYTRIETSQSHLLASYEKPLTKLCPKEVFASLLLKDQNPFEFNATLPYDLVLSLLGLFALELEMGYVFFEDSSSKSFDLSYDHYHLPKACEITISRDGLLIDRGISKKSKNIFDLISKHFKEESLKDEKIHQKGTPIKNHQKLIVFLSKKHPTCFWIKDADSYKTALPICFETNPKLILEKIRNDYKDGQKLLKNYEEHFKDILTRISSLSHQSLESSNLMDIFSSACFVLGYCSDFKLGDESILNNAKKFVRDKGPRIDFKLIKEDEILKLDYPKVIRSSMSFRIAGLDEATLSYGFIDSIAEFLGNFVRDVSVNFNIKNVLLCGDMLGEKIFLDKILHYLPKNIDLILPKEGYIDYS